MHADNEGKDLEHHGWGFWVDWVAWLIMIYEKRSFPRVLRELAHHRMNCIHQLSASGRGLAVIGQKNTSEANDLLSKCPDGLIICTLFSVLHTLYEVVYTLYSAVIIHRKESGDNYFQFQASLLL
jgi:hypothetical protein